MNLANFCNLDCDFFFWILSFVILLFYEYIGRFQSKMCLRAPCQKVANSAYWYWYHIFACILRFVIRIPLQPHQNSHSTSSAYCIDSLINAMMLDYRLLFKHTKTERLDTKELPTVHSIWSLNSWNGITKLKFHFSCIPHVFVNVSFINQD